MEDNDYAEMNKAIVEKVVILFHGLGR